MAAPFPLSAADDAATRAARLERAALDLVSLCHDAGLDPYRTAAVGAAVPFLPSPATLAAAEAALSQVARCLRHHAGASSTPSAGVAP